MLIMITIVKHPEGVVDSDPVWLVTAPHCQSIKVYESQRTQHTHVMATNMIGPRKVKFSARLGSVAHTNTAF
jgi:hypothetical protein